MVDENYTFEKFHDAWAKLTCRELKKTYESFNEVRLFLKHKRDLRGKHFVEIGCSAGELYRYLRMYHPTVQYYGFDISQSAINRSKEKYPEANFSVCRRDLSDIRSVCPNPAVVFARDVILHQTKPFEFLERVLALPCEMLVMRLRTRDVGPTVLDPDLSCQWSYTTWIPYMVLNVDEVLDTVKKTGRAASISLIKNYRQLGGWNFRYLPKDCYDPKTGTAETAMLVQFSSDPPSTPKIEIGRQADSDPRYTLVDRALRKMRNAFVRT